MFSNVTGRLGINNLLDKDPPLVGQDSCPAVFCNGNTFPQVYDTLGRFVFLGLDGGLLENISQASSPTHSDGGLRPAVSFLRTLRCIHCSHVSFTVTARRFTAKSCRAIPRPFSVGPVGPQQRVERTLRPGSFVDAFDRSHQRLAFRARHRDSLDARGARGAGDDRRRTVRSCCMEWQLLAVRRRPRRAQARGRSLRCAQCRTRARRRAAGATRARVC